MLNDSDILVPGPNNAVVPKSLDVFGTDRWSLRDKKAFVELEEMTAMKKKETAIRKETERLNKIHLKKSGSGHMKDSMLKKPKEEESEIFKGRNARKAMEMEKMARKGKNEKKVVQETTPRSAKVKALSAFGTTFYKTESETTNTKPLSSSGRFRRCKRNRSREGEDEDEYDEYLPSAKFTSRRKAPEEGEDGRKVKGKGGKFQSVQRIGSDSSLQDGKASDGKKANKTKVITAFGSTFRETENDIISLPKKKATFTDRLTRSKSTKLKTVDGVEVEDEVGTKANTQKNKLTDMVEESGKSRARNRDSTTTRKRARSPYQTSAELKGSMNKVRVEGDAMGAKQDERAEIGREMSFFEKIQQNVRAYFSQKSPEMAKYEEEKQPVQEGEIHPIDEGIMIRKEDGIMKGVKSLILVAQVDVFEKGSTSFESGGKTERNGSGPGGNINYTFGDSLHISNISYSKRSKLQKNALAEPTSECSTSVGLILEPGEQVQNSPSAYGVASAFAQVQEFHQEITRRIAKREMSVLVQEEYLTPIVTCLPGDSVPERARWESGQAGNCHTRSRLTRNRYSATSRKHPQDLHATRRKIHSSRSEGVLNESNAFARFVTDGFQRGDIPRQTVTETNKKFQPDKRQFVPRRTRWFVYSLTETVITDKSLPTPPHHTLQSDVTAISMADEETNELDKKEDQNASGSNKTQEPSPSFTLKDIISLTRKVFQENDEGKKESAAKNERIMAKNIDPSLGYYLEKLMHEKRNYLNLQKTKNFRKTQKINLIADSFNFFNLLNKEFLSVKTSNPSVEKLRNVIAENKHFKMEEYLNMYKKVIRTSLTKPEQCLMDKAKVDLERHADMYYDLMKYICMEKERKNAEKSKAICSKPSGSAQSGNSNRMNYVEILKHCMEKGKKNAEKSKAVCSNPSGPPQSGNSNGMNYFEILKQDTRRNVNRNDNWGNDYLERIKPGLDRSFNMEKIQENRNNREFNVGKNTYRTSNPRKGIEKEQKLTKVSTGPEKVKQVVELLSPPKNKGATLRKDAETNRKVQKDHGKVLLTISVCNGGLIIQQVTESSKGDTDTTTESTMTNSAGLLESSEEDRKKKLIKPLPAENKRSCSRNSVSETNLGASNGTSFDEAQKTQSELLLRTESDATVYPKSSVDEENESSESPVEHPVFKFRAFRKLLNEGLKYLTSFGESTETEEHYCPKISKGGKVPEIHQEPIKYPKAKIYVKDPPEKETRKLFGEYKPEYQKSTHLRDVRQPLPRDRGSPVRARLNEVQEDRGKKSFMKNLSPLSTGVSPNKPSKKESSGEEDSKGKKGASFWWRNDRNSIKNTSSARPRTPYRPPVRKPEVNASSNRKSLPKTPKEAEATTPHTPLRGTRKSIERKSKKAPKKVEKPKLQDSQSEYATPTGSYFEWQFGVNSLKYLLNEMPSTLLNPGVVNVGKPNSEEAEEKELRKMDLSCEEEAIRDSPAQASSNELETRQTSLRLRGNNPLRTDWDQLLEASFRKDYHKVSEVLNQFMGNISEAWKAAMYLREIIKSKSVKEPIQDSQEKKNSTNSPTESFRNFLRILTKVFEDNQEETSLRRELFLVMKEVLESSTATPSVKAVLNEIPYTGNRTIFYREIAEIPLEVRQMVAEELVSRGKNFSSIREDYEPGSFVMAVKDVGERLKSLYFTEDEEVETVTEKPEEVSKEAKKEVPKPKKIYYRLRKNGPEGTTIKSNIRSLAEKFNQIYKEQKSHTEEQGIETKMAESEEDQKDLKKIVRTQSAVYFDAQDKFQHSEDAKPDLIALNTADESYFSDETFGKNQDLIYDKIIALLKSDNPHDISYGVALLGKMMEDDRQSTNKKKDESSSLVEEEREKKWYDLVDKLIEMCHVIEAEMKGQVEKRLATKNGIASEESEWAKTCEYLNNHVDKMKILMEEMKETEMSRQHEKESTAKVQALEESRQTNMERQLMASTDLTANSYRNQKYPDKAIAFINSIGILGYSIDKFSSGLLSTWFGRDSIQVKESASKTKDDSDSVLESNKAILMSLRKNIDKRQKRIKEMIDRVEKDGVKREECFTDERLTRKVRDLKRCYNLLEKMIYDPTMLPPKCFRLTEDADGELFEGNAAPEKDIQVMTALEGTEDAKETSLVRYSHSNAYIPAKKNAFQQFPVGMLTWINMNIGLGFDVPVKGQVYDEEQSLIQRPKTA